MEKVTFLVVDTLRDLQDVFAHLEDMVPQVEHLGEVMASCILSGNKVMWMGNGGSASQSQHLAGELVGRFKKERKGLASIALTADSTILTAIGNDYGYDDVFSRQIEALGKPGDMAVGLSTSGNSKNVVRGLTLAKETGIHTVGLTGGSGGRLLEICDTCLVVPSDDTPRIQEAHLWIGHTLCQIVEDAIVTGMKDA